MSFEEFKARILGAGYAPSDASLRDMYAALPHLEAMRQRLRRGYGYGDEPAVTYAAGSATE